DMLSPPRERGLDLRSIGAAVVDAGDAGAMAAEMVQRRLDDVRLDAEVGHAGRDGPAHIVQAPRLHGAGEPMIELRLATIPRCKAIAPVGAEYVVASRLRH